MSIKNIESNLEYFKNKPNLDLDYSFEIDSGKKGPTIVISGATHGNETGGVDAMIKFCKYLEDNNLNILKGKLIFILGNPLAYKKGIRFVDENLNRSFVANISNNYEGNRALAIRNFLKSQQNIKYWLDLHSVSSGDFKMIAYIKSLKHEKTATKISPLSIHFCLKKGVLPGSTCEEATKLGINGFIVECGNHYLESTIDTALYHIIYLLKSKKMLPKNHFEDLMHHLQHSLEITIYTTIDIIRVNPDFKFLDSDNITTGYFLKKGQIFATSSNTNCIYKTKKDCYIVMPDKNPKLTDTDAGFLCEKIVKKLIF